jgi:hypothetical protein
MKLDIIGSKCYWWKYGMVWNLKSINYIGYQLFIAFFLWP